MLAVNGGEERLFGQQCLGAEPTCVRGKKQQEQEQGATHSASNLGLDRRMRAWGGRAAARRPRSEKLNAKTERPRACEIPPSLAAIQK